MSDADEFDSYDLEPVPEPIEPPGPVPVEVQGIACKQCSYDLSGLSEIGVCPECGLEIQRSMTEDYLEFSSPAYLKSLHTGVVLILIAVILKLLIIFGSIGLVSVSGVGTSLLYEGILALGLVASLLLAGGWWMFSALDPAYAGRLDGAKARKMVRITTLIVAGISLVLFPMQLVGGRMGVGILGIVTDALGLVSFAAWATGFFAAMLYLRWLSPRFPNWWAYKRAKLLMWLGPVLFTVGWLCIGLGPLVAVILYWNMLERIRVDLKKIRNGHSIAYRAGSTYRH